MPGTYPSLSTNTGGWLTPMLNYSFRLIDTKSLLFHSSIWKHKGSLNDLFLFFFYSKLFFLALSASEIFASVMSQYNH